MRDGLLFGLALLFAFGTFMFAQGIYYTYHDICRGNLNQDTKPIYCDQTTLYSMGAMAGGSSLTSLFLFWVWWSGPRLGDDVAPARRADGEAGTGPGVMP